MNIRFIKTQVNYEPVLLRLSECNLCPLLVFDTENKIAKCGIYTHMSEDYNDYSNVISSDINAYSVSYNTTVPITIVSIPDWCGLCFDPGVANLKTASYIKSGNKFTKLYNNNGVLPIVSSFNVKYDTSLNRLYFNKRLIFPVIIIISISLTNLV